MESIDKFMLAVFLPVVLVAAGIASYDKPSIFVVVYSLAVLWAGACINWMKHTSSP